ncbi:MAG: 2OG-Fe(II) oxygenase family protein, partial [Sphingomonas bacterium]|nr:2OG-Fe(II) oxygenase family protein [Sphingomonas bacterium]
QHIHPLGLISSAAYFAVPPSAADPVERAGWLELGRPPLDLRLDLPPITTIEPRVGECVLFPSTLYHGTRPFPAGKRMSVAIDINVDGA